MTTKLTPAMTDALKFLAPQDMAFKAWVHSGVRTRPGSRPGDLDWEYYSPRIAAATKDALLNRDYIVNVNGFWRITPAGRAALGNGDYDYVASGDTNVYPFDTQTFEPVNVLVRDDVPLLVQPLALLPARCSSANAAFARTFARTWGDFLAQDYQRTQRAELAKLDILEFAATNARERRERQQQEAEIARFANMPEPTSFKRKANHYGLPKRTDSKALTLVKKCGPAFDKPQPWYKRPSEFPMGDTVAVARAYASAI